MNRIVRFRLWIGCVVGILLLLPASDVASRTFQLPYVAVAGLLTVCIAILLLTTPADAIKLPPRRSVNSIVLATVWMLVCQVILIERAEVAAVGFVLATAIYAWALTRCRVSPWWAAVLAWQPAFLGPLAMPLACAAGGMLLAAAVASLFALRARPELTL